MRRWLASMMLTMWWACGLPGEARAATDYCVGSKRAVLFLIDRTTAYDERDQEVLVGGMERFFRELGTGDRLLLYTIGASPADSRRLFDRCVPGCPDEGFLGNLFSSCKAMVARADRQVFTRDLVKMLVDLLHDQQDHPASAIIETIRSVAASNRAGHPTRLVLFSDMLENTELLTFEQLLRDGAGPALARVEQAGMVPDLAGMEVDAFGLGRSHAKDRPALSGEAMRTLTEFWEGLFAKAGAADSTIGPDYVEGTD